MLLLQPNFEQDLTISRKSRNWMLDICWVEPTIELESTSRRTHSDSQRWFFMPLLCFLKYVSRSVFHHVLLFSSIFCIFHHQHPMVSPTSKCLLKLSSTSTSTEVFTSGDSWKGGSDLDTTPRRWTFNSQCKPRKNNDGPGTGRLKIDRDSFLGWQQENLGEVLNFQGVKLSKTKKNAEPENGWQTNLPAFSGGSPFSFFFRCYAFPLRLRFFGRVCCPKHLERVEKSVQIRSYDSS